MRSASLSNERTWAPGILAQVSRVKTLRINGPFMSTPGLLVRLINAASTLSRDDIGNLDNRINLGVRKDAFSPRTLNVKGKDTQWSQMRPFALGRVADYLVCRGRIKEKDDGKEVYRYTRLNKMDKIKLDRLCE